MIKTIYPSKVFGTIETVSSKSMAHRLLICAGLSKTHSLISDVDLNADIQATIDVLIRLGAKIEISKNIISVYGIDVNKKLDTVELDANESGSTIRFLIPLASFISKEVVFKGSQKLMERPQSVYKEIYDNCDNEFNVSEHIYIKGSLSANYYVIKGNVSSQFISGLLFLLPLLNADSIIEVVDNFESKPYVDMTVDALKQFNVEVSESGNKYYIKGSQTYKAQSIACEKDFSQAAFFFVLGAINSTISISNMNIQSKQGDKFILDILANLGVKIKETAKEITVFKSDVGSSVVDMSQTPDLGPILFVLGLFSSDKLVLENIERLRIKESDRIAEMKCELSKFGANIEVFSDKVIIHRLDHFKFNESVDSHNDHRIVMALSILATVLDHPLQINNSEAILKSYPRFFEDLKKLNVQVD